MWKHMVIPHILERGKPIQVPEDGLASYQLVGEVKAHQGEDG